VEKRLREALAKLTVEVNEEKSRRVDLQRGESFGFLGFEIRRVRSLRGRWMPLLLPKGKKRRPYGPDSKESSGPRDLSRWEG
jgi:RNA-directed DNA polymerase